MMLKLNGTLVLVGAGKMGGAMLEGWLKGGADPRKIVAFDPAPPPEMKALLATHGIRLNPPLRSGGRLRDGHDGVQGLADAFLH